MIKEFVKYENTSFYLRLQTINASNYLALRNKFYDGNHTNNSNAIISLFLNIKFLFYFLFQLYSDIFGSSKSF